MGYLESIRKAELELVRPYFRTGMRVLEIGGGSGYQASLLAGWGCNVTSLDVNDQSSLITRYYAVQMYDGRRIPFPDQTFDVVFSSNVLEHVRELAALCSEMRRVLRPNGLAIHFMPTPAWRFWTSLAHYPFLIRRVFDRLFANPASAGQLPMPPRPGDQTSRAPAQTRKIAWTPGPHGEYPSALAELFHFRRSRWVTMLQGSGLRVRYAGLNRLFYTGYTLLPSLSLRARRVAASVLGSSSHVFVLRAI